MIVMYMVMWQWICHFEMGCSDFGGSDGCVSWELILVLALCVTPNNSGGRFVLLFCYGNAFKYCSAGRLSSVQ